MTILTEKAAKRARNKVQLSQAKVATDLGINRSYLSLFENGRYRFDDATLEKLRSYYQDHGYDFDSAPDLTDPDDEAAQSGSTVSSALRNTAITLVVGAIAFLVLRRR